ncbi:hypothetical protein EYW49_19640 [Siculibacillus lacustris]|uniref:Uncharacterized protein n=1 Tax=Siculibacillus lacustris TaxID=1549641 RepID=A0A4V2KSN7_9HYPH|nr:hypothetical protein [Siculibacillus lacustris]TBW33694.1 hypothetical protein EYW49_19640 [Siculibacillus lacustris]
MTAPAENRPPRSRLARAAAAVARLPLLILVTLYFIIDEVVLAAVRPVIARIGAWRLFERLAAAILSLPAYPTLILFLVPFAILEPFKIWGLILLAGGHFVSGAIMLAASHLTSIVLVERLFHLTRPKLLTIAWFAAVYLRVERLYAWSLGRLKATAAWALVQSALAAVRGALRTARKAIAARLKPLLAELAAGLRRLAPRRD